MERTNAIQKLIEEKKLIPKKKSGKVNNGKQVNPDKASEVKKTVHEKDAAYDLSDSQVTGTSDADIQNDTVNLPDPRVFQRTILDSETKNKIATELEPTHTIKGYRVRQGIYSQSGATVFPGGVNFTVQSHGATGASLVLYRRNRVRPFAVLPFPKSFRVGDTWSMMVFELDIEELEYCYRLKGPYDPANGLLFNKENDLLDPYARAVVGQSYWGVSQKHRGFYRARVVHHRFDWENSEFPNTKMEDSIIYEMHVRGFTEHTSSGVKYPGTFAGVAEKIPYLKKLGITAVELMPIMEFDETLNSREFGNSVLYEYWGYNTVAFFAPNTAYAASHEYNYEGTELKNMVRALHENGIEVIMDVVFNHTAEGDERGPVISFKGFDNNICYMLKEDGSYQNYSGCGNTVNCNFPRIRRFILDCLQYWVTEYHIDGFRFDLASILGRSQDGKPMENPPLLEMLADDPLLGKTKLIAEAWDAGGLYQVGSFPAYKRWAEWNGSYRDCLRDYIKGVYWNAPEVANRILGSSDIYHGVYDGYTSSVNFLTCHDGFTLNDLFSYNQKHNERNGWNNTDGADDNRSWNCGVEGETDDPEILKLRGRLMRNAIAILMTSRGTPMILSGDEFCNTQYGDNNSYCQDNEISWLNWNDLNKNKNYFDFYRHMIRFRKEHTCIRKEMPEGFGGMPRQAAMDARPGRGAVTSETSIMRILFSGNNLKKRRQGDAVLVYINTYWDTQNVVLPELPGGYHWDLYANTDDPGEEYYYKEPIAFRKCQNVYVGPRTVLVFALGRD